MQSKIFSRILFLIVIIITGVVIVSIAQKASQAVPYPLDALNATTTESTSTADDASAQPAASISDEILGTASIQAPHGTIQAMVASTSDEREQGLSDRDSLGASEGMLFQFDAPGSYGFWMKDMHFPLDFVWILANKKVASVVPAIAPDTYPQVFYPPVYVKYVLELNSGAAAKEGIATGTQLSF